MGIGLVYFIQILFYFRFNNFSINSIKSSSNIWNIRISPNRYITLIYNYFYLRYLRYKIERNGIQTICFSYLFFPRHSFRSFKTGDESDEISTTNSLLFSLHIECKIGIPYFCFDFRLCVEGNRDAFVSRFNSECIMREFIFHEYGT